MREREGFRRARNRPYQPYLEVPRVVKEEGNGSFEVVVIEVQVEQNRQKYPHRS